MSTARPRAAERCCGQCIVNFNSMYTHLPDVNSYYKTDCLVVKCVYILLKMTVHRPHHGTARCRAVDMGLSPCNRTIVQKLCVSYELYSPNDVRTHTSHYIPQNDYTNYLQSFSYTRNRAFAQQ